MMAALALALAAAAPGASAHAAPSRGAPNQVASPPDSDIVSGIDVVAPARPKVPPSRAEVETYVESIGVMALSGQLATWSRTALVGGPTTPGGAAADSLAGQTVCPQIMGLPPAYAEFIVARIRKVGTALGAPVSRKPCDASANNLVVVFTPDAPAFIRKLADDKPRAFGFEYHGALVEDLAKPPGPIKAWYGVRTVATEPRFSRLLTAAQSAIFQVLIVVDTNKTDAVNMGQVSDYVTMIALAQIRPDKVPPLTPSILNLFNDVAAGRTPADGMTRMDAAYLQALYAVGPRQPGMMQNNQIAERVRAQLKGK
jgi:hypothetical protein